jgi:hypothetical protein
VTPPLTRLGGYLLSKLACLTLCLSIQLLALLARGDTAPGQDANLSFVPHMVRAGWFSNLVLVMIFLVRL